MAYRLAARGDMSPDSDVDIMVEFEPGLFSPKVDRFSMGHIFGERQHN